MSKRIVDRFALEKKYKKHIYFDYDPVLCVLNDDYRQFFDDWEAKLVAAYEHGEAEGRAIREAAQKKAEKEAKIKAEKEAQEKAQKEAQKEIEKRTEIVKEIAQKMKNKGLDLDLIAEITELSKDEIENL